MIDIDGKIWRGVMSIFPCSAKILTNTTINVTIGDNFNTVLSYKILFHKLNLENQ